jgi:hypothetical protein
MTFQADQSHIPGLNVRSLAKGAVQQIVFMQLELVPSCEVLFVLEFDRSHGGNVATGFSRSEMTRCFNMVTGPGVFVLPPWWGSRVQLSSCRHFVARCSLSRNSSETMGDTWLLGISRSKMTR